MQKLSDKVFLLMEQIEEFIENNMKEELEYKNSLQKLKIFMTVKPKLEYIEVHIFFNE